MSWDTGLISAHFSGEVTTLTTTNEGGGDLDTERKGMHLHHVCASSYHGLAGGEGMADDTQHITTGATKALTLRNPRDSS